MAGWQCRAAAGLAGTLVPSLAPYRPILIPREGALNVDPPGFKIQGKSSLRLGTRAAGA